MKRKEEKRIRKAEKKAAKKALEEQKKPRAESGSSQESLKDKLIR